MSKTLINNFKPLKFFSYIGISNAIGLPLDLAYTVLLARFLPPSQLGLLFAGEAFVGLFSFFYTMGLQNSIFKQAAKAEAGDENTFSEDFKENLQKAMGKALLIRTIFVIPVGILILLIALANHFYFGQETLLTKVILTYIFVFSCNSFMTVFGIVRRALNEFKLISVINVLNRCSRLLLMVVVFSFIPNSTIETYLTALVIDSLLRLLLSAISTIRICPPKFDFNNLYEMIKDCFLYGTSNYLNQSSRHIDRLMISYFIGVESVAFYAIPSKLNRAIQVLPKSVNMVFQAQIFSLVNDAKKTSSLLKKIFWILMALGIPACLGIYFFSKDFLSLIFDKAYQPAIELAPLFAFIAFIWFLEPISNMILASRNDHKGRISIQVFALVSNVILNFLLIPKFGIEGVIWSTIFTKLMRLILLSFRSRKKYVEG